MSTFLIETTEQDSFLAVVRHVADLLQEQSELVNDAEQFVANGQYGSLLGLLLQHVDLIFKQTESPHTGCCINIICHLVPRVEPPSASVKAAGDLADALASKPEHRSGEKLQAMLELFNTLVLPEAQHTVLRKALAFAKANKLASLAPPLRGKAELWASQWGLSNEEAIQLHVACADVLALHPSPVLAKEAFLLKNKALACCRAQDAASLAALKSTAASAALEFIASPSLFSWDLVNTPVVRQLKDDKAHAKTYALLSTMLTGGLKQFRSENFSDVLSKAGVSQDDCLDKMRLMALVALGSKHEGEDLAFKAIEAELDLQPGDAEAWLVRAFGKGLLDGRIDQVRECVSVRRCERRVFEKSDWQRLLDDLSMWKENISNLSTTMKNSKLLTPTCTVEPWIAS